MIFCKLEHAFQIRRISQIEVPFENNLEASIKYAFH